MSGVLFGRQSLGSKSTCMVIDNLNVVRGTGRSASEVDRVLTNDNHMVIVQGLGVFLSERVQVENDNGQGLGGRLPVLEFGKCDHTL